MSDFDARLKVLVSRARLARPRDETVPFGFAGRVVALAEAPQEQPAEEVWGRMILRLLAGAVPVLVLIAILEAPHLRGSPSLESGVQDTVAQIVWRL